MTAKGGCLCGAVRFTYEGEVGQAGYCHCADCRRCTGSAFNISVKCEATRLHIERGSLSGYTKEGGSGHSLTRHFCARCGSPILTSSPRHPEFVYVKAGAWDDPGINHPAHQAWVASAVSWHMIQENLPTFKQSRS